MKVGLCSSRFVSQALIVVALGLCYQERIFSAQVVLADVHHCDHLSCLLGHWDFPRNVSVELFLHQDDSRKQTLKLQIKYIQILNYSIYEIIWLLIYEYTRYAEFYIEVQNKSLLVAEVSMHTGILSTSYPEIGIL